MRDTYLGYIDAESGRPFFGTNVIEAVLVALIGKRIDEITAEDYLMMLKEMTLGQEWSNLRMENCHESIYPLNS